MDAILFVVMARRCIRKMPRSIPLYA